MTFGALAAVGACVQIAKTLYEYYAIHKHNRALLDILEGFTSNLCVSIDRLKAREQLFSLKQNGQNEALESIERDFGNAKKWLEANDKNLKSIWTALQAADKLKDLDDRLTKAFASKMSIAIFSALQDTRLGVEKIQTTLEGLPKNLETVCRASTKEAIHEAITELKEEAYQAIGGEGGRAKGFRNGEAEKIISQLVDQLAEQERIKEDEEEDLLQSYVPLEPTVPYSAVPGPSSSSAIPYTSISTPSSRRTSQVPSTSTSNPFEPSLDNHFDPTSASSQSSSRRSSSLRPGTTTSHSHRRQSTHSTSDQDSSTSDRPDKFRKRDKLAPGSILFLPKDPFTNRDLIDPILANDGLIHDRWSLVSEGPHENLKDPFEPLGILGDVVQLREAIFEQYPERRIEFQLRREKFKEETIQLYDSSSYLDLPNLINRLSHVLLYEPNSISTRIRRAICRYRLRDLSNALEDLDHALELSVRVTVGEDGIEKEGNANLDALRIKALVLTELHDNTSAFTLLDKLLSISPNDVLALSLRARLRANLGDFNGAQDDLAETNLAVKNDLAYRSRLGDGECDLEYLARGWGYSSVHDYESALNDFNFSLFLRSPPDPYTLACRSLASIKLFESQHFDLSSSSQLDSALEDLNASIEMWRELAITQQEKNGSSSRETSGVERIKIENEDGLPRVAYQCLLLRASARQTQGEPQLALLDFETSLRLRPPGVRELPSLVCALAQIRAECGDIKGAKKGFELAIATAGSKFERQAFERARDES
ncbi:uncharacterized protein JCM6883_004157 [Sporobolomyces salmoneus]|uniref:uncharacterized protein n=1 Tax=Sporobolomyces salmoneus TaxID=183962 RepID=UPI003175D9BE